MVKPSSSATAPAAALRLLKSKTKHKASSHPSEHPPKNPLCLNSTNPFPRPENEQSLSPSVTAQTVKVCLSNCEVDTCPSHHNVAMGPKGPVVGRSTELTALRIHEQSLHLEPSTFPPCNCKDSPKDQEKPHIREKRSDVSPNDVNLEENQREKLPDFSSDDANLRGNPSASNVSVPADAPWMVLSGEMETYDGTSAVISSHPLNENCQSEDATRPQRDMRRRRPIASSGKCGDRPAGIDQGKHTCQKGGFFPVGLGNVRAAKGLLQSSHGAGGDMRIASGRGVRVQDLDGSTDGVRERREKRPSEGGVDPFMKANNVGGVVGGMSGHAGRAPGPQKTGARDREFAGARTTNHQGAGTMVSSARLEAEASEALGNRVLKHVSENEDHRGAEAALEVVDEKPKKSRLSISWACQECARECVPVREESRCLCGHRLREHPSSSMPAGTRNFACRAARCKCRHFFFVVAEGAWVLRCRCKHKHVEHDPVTHACARKGCTCARFDSPWVCNCNHPWASHKQSVVSREVRSLSDMLSAMAVAPEVNAWDQLQRGKDS